MARIRVISATPDGEAVPGGAQVQRDLAGILAHTPEIRRGLSAFTQALKANRTLTPRLVELVRLRIAFHNQCRSCMSIRYQDAVADGVTEDLVCSLERPAEATDLTPAEVAALRYADLFATNHLAIDDTIYDDLRGHFTEAQIVELGLNCALDVGVGRLAATWDIVEALPERFRQRGDEPVTPWGSDALVVS